MSSSMGMCQRCVRLLCLTSSTFGLQGDNPAAFPFFYIEPAKPENLHITEKFVGKLTRKMAENIAPIGERMAPFAASAWSSLTTAPY